MASGRGGSALRIAGLLLSLVLLAACQPRKGGRFEPYVDPVSVTVDAGGEVALTTDAEIVTVLGEVAVAAGAPRPVPVEPGTTTVVVRTRQGEELVDSRFRIATRNVVVDGVDPARLHARGPEVLLDASDGGLHHAHLSAASSTRDARPDRALAGTYELPLALAGTGPLFIRVDRMVVGSAEVVFHARVTNESDEAVPYDCRQGTTEAALTIRAKDPPLTVEAGEGSFCRDRSGSGPRQRDGTVLLPPGGSVEEKVVFDALPEIRPTEKVELSWSDYSRTFDLPSVAVSGAGFR